MAETIQAEVILEAQAQLGEGPIWDGQGQQLLWVDIEAEEVHLLRPDTGQDRALAIGQMVGAAAVRTAGGFVLAVRDGFALLDSDSGAVTMIAEVEAGNRLSRMNDGKCDPAGRFWAGTMALDFAPGAGSLYRLDPDHRLTLVVPTVTISNGLGWSPDKRTMYYIDTPTRGVDAFDFEIDTGAIARRRRLITIPRGAGSPDGMTVDADGCLWVALWGGSSMHRYTPDGHLDRNVALPAAFITSGAFGGPNLDVLYITSAANPVPAAERSAQPHAGAVFACHPGVRGLAANEYGG
ncbi:MAG: SMP-30/gluconolactonase/LRE family protein [Dehalococcoidia bacterium]